MFTRGATNVALGKEACSGSYDAYQNQKQAGTLSFLRENRKYMQAQGQVSDPASQSWDEIKNKLDKETWLAAYRLRSEFKDRLESESGNAKLRALAEELEAYTEERLRGARDDIKLVETN